MDTKMHQMMEINLNMFKMNKALKIQMNKWLVKSMELVKVLEMTMNMQCIHLWAMSHP